MRELILYTCTHINFNFNCGEYYKEAVKGKHLVSKLDLEVVYYWKGKSSRQKEKYTKRL
jgi:hypothetical protein